MLRKLLFGCHFYIKVYLLRSLSAVIRHKESGNTFISLYNLHRYSIGLKVIQFRKLWPIILHFAVRESINKRKLMTLETFAGHFRSTCIFGHPFYGIRKMHKAFV
jgi:hypothetical protein